MSEPVPNGSRSVFIADSCIGGLSVVKSIWNSGNAGEAVFLADYAVNPLGVKSDSDIAHVVAKWMGIAERQSDILFFACNTLSIRHHQLARTSAPVAGLKQIVSMVDCFIAMVKREAHCLANQRVLIIGTTFTASQSLYPDLLRAASPDVQVSAVPATELERSIARFEPWEDDPKSIVTEELRKSLEATDIAILACTCFPMARAQLEAFFPAVRFLDPGEYRPDGLIGSVNGMQKKLSIYVTGDVVTPKRVTDFAKSYLDEGLIESIEKSDADERR